MREKNQRWRIIYAFVNFYWRRLKYKNAQTKGSLCRTTKSTQITVGRVVCVCIKILNICQFNVWMVTINTLGFISAGFFLILRTILSWDLLFNIFFSRVELNNNEIWICTWEVNAIMKKWKYYNLVLTVLIGYGGRFTINTN